MPEDMIETADTEAAMREATVPWPKTEEQLLSYIRSLIPKANDYGKCVYVISMIATAAFNYAASEVGATGFQASCADLDVLRRTRSLDGPFMIMKGEDALYPQYDLPKRLAESMEGWKPWLKEQADKKLAEGGPVHDAVKEHWEKLAAYQPSEQEPKK